MTFQHQFIDTDKPRTGTDIFAVDVDGDGLQDVVCGSWWYSNPDWKRYEIPGIYQIVCTYDVDGDGQMELIATKRAPVPEEKNWYFGLSSDFVWLKPVDPRKGKWKEFTIGRGAGTWPHGIAMGPLLGNGKSALVVSYHSAKKEGHYPELFEVPQDPKTPNWPHRVLAELAYGEEVIIQDIDGDGVADISLGEYWLQNNGKGQFITHKVMDGNDSARLAFTDMAGKGRKDLVFTEENIDWAGKHVPLSRLAWMENPGKGEGPWVFHEIDKVRCAHSLSIGDIDGDGLDEIVCGEHLPFNPYTGDARLLVYKRKSKESMEWEKFVVAEGYEHHDGTKLIDLGNGQKGIISHGWAESKYVHLWTVNP